MPFWWRSWEAEEKMFDNKPIFDMLDRLGIKYTAVKHDAVHTMEDLKPIEQQLGAVFFPQSVFVQPPKDQILPVAHYGR